MGDARGDRRRCRRLALPTGIIASAAVGGGAGAIWGKVRDKGFTDEQLKEIGDSMEPGTSAIIALAVDRVIERLENGIAGYERIARHTVSAEAALAITAAATGADEAGTTNGGEGSQAGS